jgi:hypothetical protein
MVRAFQTFANERQLKKVAGQFEIRSAADYTPKPGDPDYVPHNDVPWLKRFAADGGKVVISGDTKMKNMPHERLALIDLKLIVIFFESQWSEWKFFTKCALLLLWWPVIADKIKRVKKPDAAFWHIPCNWKENGKLRKVSNKDPQLLRIEQREAAGRRRKKVTTPAPAPPGDGPLFEYDNSRKVQDVGTAVKAKEEEDTEQTQPR